MQRPKLLLIAPNIIYFLIQIVGDCNNNFGEVYYRIWRIASAKKADAILGRLQLYRNASLTMVWR
jgi:hypothetical protein